MALHRYVRKRWFSQAAAGGQDYGNRAQPLRSRWSPGSSDEGICTDPGDSAFTTPLTYSGFLQTLTQWIRAHLAIANLTSKFRSAYEYLLVQAVIFYESG